MANEKVSQGKEETGEKKKSPTAAKRMRQNLRQGARNAAFKSRLRTAVRRFELALSEGGKERAQGSIQQIYALMDKGVKRGLYKKNKAARVKSRVALFEKKRASLSS